MNFLNRVLEPPTYGFSRDGHLYVPTTREILGEFFKRLNLFKSKKNWLSVWSWFVTVSLSVPFLIFLTHYFSWPLFLLGMVYSMVFLGSHGTVYLHRFSTHRAFRFSNSFSRFIVRNLVIKIIPEEVYVVSHYVHHLLSEKPGDPYNAHGGWLYCFLADVNHQPIARNLSQKDYSLVAKLMNQTGVHLNTYEQYRYWGSLCHPSWTILHFVLNWSFWYGLFFLLGGHALATAIFGCSVIWAFGVRTFNYDGHGGGKDKRQEGIDFNRADLSINQVWPGYVAGEWHNNHHLYPAGARSGFLPYQLDLAWEFIRFYHWIGGISSYLDYKKDFYEKFYLPYLRQKEDQEKKGKVSLVSNC